MRWLVKKGDVYRELDGFILAVFVTEDLCSALMFGGRWLCLGSDVVRYSMMRIGDTTNVSYRKDIDHSLHFDRFAKFPIVLLITW